MHTVHTEMFCACKSVHTHTVHTVLVKVRIQYIQYGTVQGVFLLHTHSASLPRSLYETYDAVVFRGYSEHLGILCGIIENPVEILFSG